jgi:hypothetical protein
MSSCRWLLSLLFFTAICSAQSTARHGPEALAPAKDPQAVQLLSQVWLNAGWPSGAEPLTVKASGQLITETEEGQKAEPVVLIGAPDRFRLDLPNSAFVLTNNGGIAETVRNGEKSGLKTHEAAMMQAWMFPFVSELRKFTAPEASVRQISSEATTTSLLVQIPHDELVDGGLKIFIVLRNTDLLPKEMHYWRSSTQNPTARVAVTWRFSDYRLTQAGLLPFVIEELVEGRKIFRIQFNSIQIETGISNTAFGLNL